MRTAPRIYTADVPAEPLERYSPGGYHPVHIGDRFKDGRYHITHKLGWGSYSTVWLASDSKASRPVTLKILTADHERHPREVEILKRIRASSLGGGISGRTNRLCQLYDDFTITGPNGYHTCLVTEIGSTSAQLLAERYSSERLPGWLAWEISRQITQAVIDLHGQPIVHADLYPGNILIASAEGQETLLESLPQPKRYDIHATKGHALTAHLPTYVVENVEIPLDTSRKSIVAKLIDFGQSFEFNSPPSKINTPLVFRGPELLFDSRWDHRIDIWSLACTIFELVTGQPMFNNILPDKEGLTREWIAMFGPLPPAWAARAPITDSEGMDEFSVGEWLRECYFENERRTDFAEEHIEWLGEMLEGMMRYEPGERMEAEDVLRCKWFERNWLLGC
ncbi:kinase-like domain-containing protein [Elsinoe ampelina]|uniref:non-specific serine/threonine protein kinase n=1 Tax=Elsinoe ampelina TaxID=302913 RepID=A0A6A6GP23_9PEZI|nr:kinase-like domain-containing protein [Elsinoe ampelina]